MNKISAYILLTIVLLITGCNPTISVKAREKPITINLNINVEHKVKIQVDNDLDRAILNNSDLF